MWKLTLIVGAAAGYVLGARAGRQRYEQITATARKIRQNPRVRDATLRARESAGSVAGKAAVRVGDRLPDAFTDRVPCFNRRQAEDDSWGTVHP